MAAKDKAEAAASAARSAGRNAYVQRIIQDEELRDNMVVAVEAALEPVRASGADDRRVYAGRGPISPSIARPLPG